MAMLMRLALCVFLSCFVSRCYAYQFNVGGKAGWVPNPSENYNNWAERMRFQVNDTLVFKYKKGSDSVLVVNKDDYDKCNTQNPIRKMDDGNSVFKFDRSGPFFFISGNKDDCLNKAQKLVILVLAIRPRPPSPPASSSPETAPTPAVSPAISPSPSESPASSPSISPSPTESPAISPSPTESPTNSPSPVETPATSPGTDTPSSSPVPSSSESSSSPASSPPGSTGETPPGSTPPTSEGGFSPPADVNTPPSGGGSNNQNSAVKAIVTTPSALLVSVILTIALGG